MVAPRGGDGALHLPRADRAARRRHGGRPGSPDRRRRRVPGRDVRHRPCRGRASAETPLPRGRGHERPPPDSDRPPTDRDRRPCYASVRGFEEKRAAGSESAVLINIADPGPGWTPASSSCSPPLDRSSGPSTGLVAFRPAIGKSDQPWSPRVATTRGAAGPSHRSGSGSRVLGVRSFRVSRARADAGDTRARQPRGVTRAGQPRGSRPAGLVSFRPRIGKNDSNRGRQPVRRRRSSEDSAFGQRRSGCGHRSPDRPTPDR